MVQRLIAKLSSRHTPLFYANDVFVRATLVAALVISALALTLSVASAQDRGAAREACKADYQKFCSGVTPGGGRIKKCLNENLGALSEPCKQVIGAAGK
jgi:hypothetical protein